MHPQTSLHDGQSFADGFLRTENVASQVSQRGPHEEVAKFEESQSKQNSARGFYPQPVVTIVRPASTVPLSETTTPLAKGNKDKLRKTR